MAGCDVSAADAGLSEAATALEFGHTGRARTTKPDHRLMTPTNLHLAIDGGPAELPDGPPAWPHHDRAVSVAIEACVQDRSWGKYHGGHVEELERRLAEQLQVAHVYTCCSGTFAVELALRAIPVKPSDEVILAGYDFPGNFRAIEALGATPVLVDIAPDSWCLDDNHLSRAIGPKTKAVIVSHLHGGLADMELIRDWADRHGVAVIEDACQATGAVVQTRAAGSWGDVGVFSFGGSKLLTAGRGGALVTNHEDLYQRAKIYCERGNHAFPLSEIQAAVLLPQLEQLATRNAVRSARAEQLRMGCRDISALSPVAAPPENSSAAYYKFAWRLVPQATCGLTRERFVAAIQAEGVAIDVGFRGFARRGSRRCRKVGELPHSQAAADQTLLLHHPILLEDAPTVERAAAAIRKVVSGLRGR